MPVRRVGPEHLAQCESDADAGGATLMASVLMVSNVSL